MKLHEFKKCQRCLGTKSILCETGASMTCPTCNGSGEDPRYPALNEFVADLRAKLTAAERRATDFEQELERHSTDRVKMRESKRLMRETLEAIAKPALGGKEQQWKAQQCLAALKERDGKS